MAWGDFEVEGDPFGDSVVIAELYAGRGVESAAADLPHPPAPAVPRPPEPPDAANPPSAGASGSAERPDTARVSRRLRLTDPERVLEVNEGAGVLLGRQPPSPIWDHPSVTTYVSSQHARVYLVGDQLVVMDLGSTNGTFLAGIRLAQGVPMPLQPGDVLQLTRDNPVRLEVLA